ncbi:MAG: FtsQ-type POTRA domain-containing protein [Fusicatenibacter sp.]|nr:FtsQ-type POTRA domain-containing protein [Fusicatenibacter sp.]
MKQKKVRKISRKKKLKLAAACAGGVGLGMLLFLGAFQVRHVEVTGNTRYTEEEIREMAMEDSLSFNTFLLTTFHSKVDMSSIPFMESIEFEYVSNDTIRIQVTEKKTIGYVEFENQKVYFDKDGIVLECIPDGSAAEEALEPEPLSSEPIDASGEDTGTMPPDPSASESEPEEGSGDVSSASEAGAQTEEQSKEQGMESLSSDAIQSARVTVSEFHPTLENVPLVTGLLFDEVKENEPLNVEDPSVFRTILAITRMIEKYDILPDSVEFCEDGQIVLHYYDTVRIKLGKDDNLEEKMTKLSAILPRLQGMSGVLHMEDYTEESGNFVFTKDT